MATVESFPGSSVTSAVKSGVAQDVAPGAMSAMVSGPDASSVR